VRMQEEEYLAHYGILRKSGRYPWGSGKNPLQRSKTFLETIEQHRKIDKMSDSQIAKAYSPVDKDGNIIKDQQMTVADLRALKSRAVTETKIEQIRTAQKLRDKGMGASAIARQMDINESTVRSLLEPGRQEKLDILQQTADMLKRQVDEKGIIDVGSKVNLDLPIGDNPATRIGISDDKFATALSMLKEEGYRVHTFNAPQVGTGEMTKYKVLVPPGVTQKQAWAQRNEIRLISEKSDDNGRTFRGDLGIQPPLNISAKRVAIRYKEDGGADADGVIYVRPGVPDVSLGKSRYAQVRIAVNGTHYLKGMAVYKDDLPDGVDLQFNTNKSSTGNKLEAMKPLKVDPETGEVDKGNPFGAVIKDGGQILNSKGKVSSAMNLINEEGDWDKWSRTLSSQVLSKQKPELAETQLNLTYERRREELEQIRSLTNPQIKRKLLETFAEETDAAAVHLKAVNMPNQATKVILPSNHVKPNEIYAPTFENGERVALVRFPHAGKFEIPELVVNNRSREAKKMFRDSEVPDAVAIHPKVAERLSGADFDGDHVVVIPNNKGQITHTPALEKLKGFDPQADYGPYDGMRTIDGGVYNAKSRSVDYGVDSKGNPKNPNKVRKQNEMGNVTNLISDMTIRGASNDELARAVKHSMVVIDSEKHNLDFKASERANGILDLKKTYQGVNPKTGQARGAATLITRATAQTHPKKRKAKAAGPGRTRISSGTVDNRTGKKLWDPTGEKRKDGKDATFRSQKLAETDDAYTLVSTPGRGTRMEQIYADHSNRLKALANETRRELISVKPVPYSPSANKVYKHEVDSLSAKLLRAEKNAPLERQAQAVARRIVADRKRANPGMEKDEERKIKGQALNEARLRTGAGKVRLGSKDSPITDKEWDAIQNGAISNHMLERILKNSDLDVIRERATPRVNPVMTPVATARAKQMLASGATPSEVSRALGIAVSTLMSGIADGGG